MSLAICISCGSTKNAFNRKCPVCGFLPASDEEKAKSIILSLDYEIAGQYRGKTKEELLSIALAIREKSFKFDAEEVAGVIRYADGVKGIPAARLAIDLIQWLALPVAILIAVFYLLWVTR
jgi:hypothetical protein